MEFTVYNHDRSVYSCIPEVMQCNLSIRVVQGTKEPVPGLVGARPYETGRLRIPSSVLSPPTYRQQRWHALAGPKDYSFRPLSSTMEPL
jgi:hypothetical protein